MPKYTGGDITDVTFNHPTLGSFQFATKSGESYNLDPGGIRSEDDSAGISGNGVMIDKKTRVRWSFDGPLMADFESNLEVDNFPKIAESAEQGTLTVTLITGVTWRGLGTLVGDIAFDTSTAQASIKFSGGGKMVKF